METAQAAVGVAQSELEEYQSAGTRAQVKLKALEVYEAALAGLGFGSRLRAHVHQMVEGARARSDAAQAAVEAAQQQLAAAKKTLAGAEWATLLWAAGVGGCTTLWAVQHPAVVWWEVPLVAAVFGLLLAAAVLPWTGR